MADMVRVAKRGIKRIANCFGLSNELTNEMIDESKNVISYQIGKFYVGYNYEHKYVVASDSRKSMMKNSEDYSKKKQR